jgi:4a-hydroxytetrahydrobiopterin dehydratase
MSHHAEGFNASKTVQVALCTHDAGGVTWRDLQLARAMDACVRI